MEYVYLDTSVFESNNFLEGSRINEILKLSEADKIRLVLPEITYQEVLSREMVNVRAALAKHKKFRSDARSIRNIPSLKNRFDDLNETEIIEEFKAIFDARLKKAKCIRIDYPTVNIKDIFEKYFADQFPFSKGSKKHEFPDAFALISIENWCKSNGNKCHVFSYDKDILSYKSDDLIISESFEDYLDDLLWELETAEKRESRLIKAKKLYEDKRSRLEKDIEDWLNQQLEDFNAYHNHTDFEIHDIDVTETYVSLSDFKIVSVTDDYIEMEAEAEVDYRVKVEVNDENTGWYDSEDKEIYYMDTAKIDIDETQTIPVSIKVDIPIAGDEYMDIEVDEINDGKELDV